MGDPIGDAPDGELVDEWPRRARLGAAVEAVTGLCYLLGLLGVLAAAIGGRGVSTRVGGTPVLLFIGGTSWEALVGGLLIGLRPRAMAGTLLETGVLNIWGATRRRAALVLVPGGAWWAALAILAGANGGQPWPMPPDLLLVGILGTCVPFLMLALGIPPVGGRRRGTASRRRR